jgi:ABC-type branched-subunit amino acid transport system ATPase component
MFASLRNQRAAVEIDGLAPADRVFALQRGAVFHEGPAQPLLTDLDYRKKILWL